MNIEQIREKLEKSNTTLMKADVKCHNCERVTKDAIYIHRADTLKDVHSNYHFEQIHSFYCPTCSNVIKVAPSDLRNLVSTSSELSEFEMADPLSHWDNVKVWSNTEESIIVPPSKIDEDNCYSVGYHDAQHFYLSDKNEPNHFNESTSIVVEWLIQTRYKTSISPRRIGRIVESDNSTLLYSLLTARLHPLYKVYLDVTLEEQDGSDPFDEL